MKFLLVFGSLLALATTSIAEPTELNDMYLHHHPSQAKKLAMAASGGNGNGRASEQNGNYHVGGYDFRKSYDDSDDEDNNGPFQRQPYRANYDDFEPRRADVFDEDEDDFDDGGGYGYNRMAAAQQDDGVTYNKNGGIDWNNPTLKGSIFVDRGYDDATFDISQNLKMASVENPGENWHTGKGTYYDVETRKSSCGFKASNKDMVAALNSKQFGGKSKNNKNCGKEVEVTGPSGNKVKVKLIDGCDTCGEGDIDLSPAAFESIGSFSHGSISIKWKDA
ncbi:unnamed protein product [Absidia cylindrospora]